MARRLTPDIISTYAQLEGVPSALALAFSTQESGGRTNAISPKGAVGAFQVMPATFKRYFPGGNINDPIDNMTAGLRVIKDGIQQFGLDPEKIGQFYYHGSALRAGEEGPTSGAGTPTTRAYGRQIAALYNRFKGDQGGMQGGTALAQLGTPAAGMTSTESLPDLFGGNDFGSAPVSGLHLGGDIVPGLKLGVQFGGNEIPGYTGSLNGQVASFGGENDVAMNEAGGQDYELEKYIRQMVDEELSNA